MHHGTQPRYTARLYILLGLLIALFVGVGISTFYPGPKMPEFPTELNTYGKNLTAQQQAAQRDWDKKIAAHEKAKKPYNRNVSIITLVAAVLFVALSIVYEKRMRFIADGVMLGGLFTLVYSIGRGFASQDSKYVFVVVTISLALVVYLGFHRFVKPEHATRT